MFEADNIYKNTCQMSFHLFLFRYGVPPMALLTSGALIDPQLPATASHVCTAPRMPPKKILATPVIADASERCHIVISGDIIRNIVACSLTVEYRLITIYFETYVSIGNSAVESKPSNQ